MTLQDGRLVPDASDAILEEMITNAEIAFGTELNPDDASVIRAFYRPIAEFLADQQEQMAEVLDASQLEHANGAQLDLLAALIGVTRRPANAAKTTLRFSRESEASQNFIIPSGTEVQTDAVDAVSFETDTTSRIAFIDGFEDNDISNLEGDTNRFSVVASPTYDSSGHALEAEANTGFVFDDSLTFYAGSVFHGRVNIGTDAVAGFAVGVQDADNYYRIVADASADTFDIQTVSDGSVSNTESVNQAVPESEWLHIKIDWKPTGNITATLYNESGNSIAEVSLDEGSATFSNGGVGYYSGDTNSTKQYDNFTMTAAGVPATSMDAGAQQNVAANRLTVMPSAPTGISAVNNPIGATGGTDRESDTAYRERAQEELAQGTAATENALLSAVQQVGDPITVDVIVNDTSTTDGDGRPSHTFEVITDVDSSFYDEVAEAILDTKAAGDVPVGGYAGTKVTRTVELINGEDKDIDFSIPTSIKLYFDIDITKDGTYAGDDEVKDAIVQYVGGTLTSTETIGGNISTGDDALFYEIVDAIMGVRGVVDITNLEFDATTTPTGTSNYTINAGEAATADATDSSINVTSSDI